MTLKIPFLRSSRIYKTEDRVNLLCWNQLMPLLAAALENGSIQIYTTLNEQPFMSIQAHSGKINDLRWSPSGLFLASVADDGFLKIWSIRSSRPILSHKSSAAITSVSWRSSDDSSLLFTNSNGVLKSFNVKESIEKMIKEDSDLLMVRSSREFKSYALSFRNGLIKIYSMNHLPIFSCLVHKFPLSQIEWIDNETRIISMDVMGNLFIWDRLSSNPQFSYSVGPSNSKFHFAPSLSGVFVFETKKIFFVDLNTLKILDPIELEGIVINIHGTKVPVFLSLSTEKSEIIIFDVLYNEGFYFPLFEYEERTDLTAEDQIESLILNFRSYFATFEAVITNKHYSLIMPKDIINNLKSIFKIKEMLSNFNLNYYLFSILWSYSISFFRFYSIVESYKRKSTQWKELLERREHTIQTIKNKELSYFEKILALIYRFQQISTKQ